MRRKEPVIDGDLTRDHKPLSETISDMVTTNGSGPLTLNRLMDSTHTRGVYLVIIILCLPFVVPVSIPGLSTIMGSIISLLVLGILLRRKVHFPRFLGERVFPPAIQRRIVGGSIAFLRGIERIVRPRRTQWLGWRPVEMINSLVVLTLAVLLALPLPSPPFFFTNTFPGCAIIIIAASMMEEDGVLIWAGYVAAIGNGIFFALIGEGIVRVILKFWHGFSQANPGL
jgi:hypothetical protein